MSYPLSYWIKNAKYLSSEGSIQKGHLYIKDGKIDKITPISNPGEKIEQCLFDASNFLTLPGLINAHTHLPMVLFRGLGDDLPLKQWLFDIIFPLESKWEPEEIYIASLVGISELLHSGCTCFADMYFFVDNIVQAVAESGIRACLSLGLTAKDKDQGLQSSEHYFKTYHHSYDQRIAMHLAPHAIYTCPPEYLSDIIALASKLDATIHMHINETKLETLEHFEKFHQQPIETLHDIGLFEQTVLAAHCVHLSIDELNILSKAKNLLVAHNPSSNMKLASGIAPVANMLKNRIKIALGTDGAASNNNLNMFTEMRIASLLSKVAENDPTSLNAQEVLNMTTTVPGKFFGDPLLGTIQENAPADLIFIENHHIHLLPNYNYISNLAYAMKGNEVNTVIINGKLIMQDHSILTFNEKQIKEKFLNIAEKYS